MSKVSKMKYFMSSVAILLSTASTVITSDKTALAVHRQTNGCGSGIYAILVPEGLNANFNGSCNQHDLCYGNLDYTKEACDNQFYNSMIDRCESTYPDWWESHSLGICYASAEVYYQAVHRSGDARRAYDDSQAHARMEQGKNFQFRNNCHRSLRLAIRYQNRSGTWETASWWNFSPNQTSYLSSNGIRLSTNNSIFYYYAELTDDSEISWSGDDRYYTVGNRRLGFTETRGSGDTLTLTLSCSNL